MAGSIAKWIHAHVIKSSDSNQTEFTRDVAPLTGELWNLILPHMICLSTQAETHGHTHSGGTSSLNDQSIWFHVFEAKTEHVIQKTLHLRTRLSGTDCEFNFLWPSAGELFDLKTMQTNGGVSLNEDPTAKRKVAFTTFPSLEVTATNSGVTSTFVVYKAMVKLYPQFG